MQVSESNQQPQHAAWVSKQLIREVDGRQVSMDVELLKGGQTICAVAEARVPGCHQFEEPSQQNLSWDCLEPHGWFHGWGAVGVLLILRLQICVQSKEKRQVKCPSQIKMNKNPQHKTLYLQIESLTYWENRRIVHSLVLLFWIFSEIVTALFPKL